MVATITSQQERPAFEFVGHSGLSVRSLHFFPLFQRGIPPVTLVSSHGQRHVLGEMVILNWLWGVCLSAFTL